jgi:tartrate-resistant acid phosphatase type 5
MSLNAILSRLPIKGATTVGNDTAVAKFVPILNDDGQLDPSFISAIARTNVFKVANQAARLALTNAHAGDIAYQNDFLRAYVLCDPTNPFNDNPDPSVNNNWLLLGVDNSLASQIGFNPTFTGSTLTATNVQTALEQLSSGTVATNTPSTITTGVTFNPPGAPGTQAPFIIGPDSTNVLVPGLNADKLDGHDGSYYNDASNLTNTVAAARLTGRYNIDVTLLHSPVNPMDAVNLQTLLDSISAGIGSLVGNTTPTPITIGATGAPGISLVSSRIDHRHAAPPLVTPTVDGFARATDKARYDFCACGAFDAPVNTLLVKDGSVYVGGTFTRYDNISAVGLARLDYAGSFVPEFQPTSSLPFNSVDKIASAKDGVYIATDLASLGTQSIHRVTRLGTLDSTFAFNPGIISTPILSITPMDSDDRLAVLEPHSLKIITSTGAGFFSASGTDQFQAITTAPQLSGSNKLVLASNAYSASHVEQTYTDDYMSDPAKADPKGLKLLDFRNNVKTSFAVIGDFGINGLTNSNEAAVSTLVHNHAPDFIVTTGDNIYDGPSFEYYDFDLGYFYSDYISPYKGIYGVGADINKFWPTIGNHDAGNVVGPKGVEFLKAYFKYFTLPGNERYYDFVKGELHFFVVDSDLNEPDGVSPTGRQATWLKAGLAASKSTWNVVVWHHPPVSSRPNYHDGWMKDWNIGDWGADALLCGHAHTYERLIFNNIPLFVVGISGNNTLAFGTPVPESQFRFTGAFGAMFVDAYSDRLEFKMRAADNSVIENYTLRNTEVVLDLGQIDTTFARNGGSGAEAACSNPLISPDGTYILAANSMGHNSLSTAWNSTTGNMLTRSEEPSESPWVLLGSPAIVNENIDLGPFNTGTADRIADNDGITLSYVSQTVSIGSGTKRYEFATYVLKEAVTNRFPVFKIILSGGATQVEVFGHLNTGNGAVTLSGNLGGGAGSITSESIGRYWRVTVGATDNNSGNNLATVSIYPAYSPTFGGAAATLTGAITVFGNQLRESTWSKAYIRTTNSAKAPFDGNSGFYRGIYKIFTDGTSADHTWFNFLTMANANDFPKIFAIDSEGYVYIGGNINNIGSFANVLTAVTPNRLYRLRPDGAFDKEYKLFNGKVNDAKLINDHTLVIGGEFTQYGSNTAGRLVYIYEDGSLAEAIVLSDDLPSTVTVAALGDSGISAAASRADHIHPSVGLATANDDGFLSKLDKRKIDALIIQDPVTLCNHGPLDIVPTMTSNSQSGYSVSASNNPPDAYKAFNEDPLTYWNSLDINPVLGVYPRVWLNIQLPAPECIQSYLIQSDHFSPPLRWNFLGSNDGTTWTTLHSGYEPDQSVWDHVISTTGSGDPTQPGTTGEGGTGPSVTPTSTTLEYVPRQYFFTNDVKYLYYRLDMENNEPAPTGPYNIVIRDLRLVSSFPVIDAQLNGQELCLDLKLTPNGGLTTHPSGLAVDYSEVAHKDHDHNVVTSVEDGLMSKEDKQRFDLTEDGGFDNEVSVVTIRGLDIYVGGKFSKYHNIVTPKIAKLDIKGHFDTKFNSGIGFSADTTLIDATDGAVYVAGEVASTYNGSVTAKHAWRLNLDGTADATFVCPTTIATTGIDVLKGLRVIDNRVVFLTPQTLHITNLSGATLFTKEAIADLYSLGRFGNKVFVAGKTNATLGALLNPQGLKLIDVSTSSQNTTFTTGAGSGADTACTNIFVALRFNRVYVGNLHGIGNAQWNGANGTNYRGIYCIDSTAGTAITSFSCNITMGTVNDSVAIFGANSNGDILFGGNVVNINGTPVTPWRMYRITNEGVFLQQYDLFNDKVLDAKITTDNIIVVGGAFTAYGKRRFGRFIMLNMDGTVYEGCCVGFNDKLPTPIFNPPSGYASSANPLSIAISVPGFSNVNIFYTTDGTTPATSVSGTTLQYTTPINITTGVTIKAIATKTGYVNSDIGVAVYSLHVDPQLPMVVFSPPSGALITVTVSMSVPEHPLAAIRYTLDGSTPTGISTLYTAPILVSTPTTIKAIGTEASYIDSPVATASYGVSSIISIDYSLTPTTKVGLAATGVNSSDVWNSIKPLGPTEGVALKYVSGASAPVVQTFVCANYLDPAVCNNISTDSWAAVPTINDAMMLNAITNIDSRNPILDRWYLNNLPGGKYNFYIYAHGPITSASCNVILYKNSTRIGSKINISSKCWTIKLCHKQLV